MEYFLHLIALVAGILSIYLIWHWSKNKQARIVSLLRSKRKNK